MTGLRIVLLAALLAVAAAAGEFRLGCVFPAGVRIGAAVEVEVAGSRLDEAASAWISGEGVTAELLPAPPPEADAPAKAKRDMLADRRRLRIAAAPGAAPGIRGLRLIGPAGATNPLVFIVSDLAEATMPAGGARDPLRLDALPATVNGRIRPGAVERVAVPARRGDRLVARLAARALVPFIPDAVPGWCQGLLVLRDPAGRIIAESAGHDDDPDPRLRWQAEADGDYLIELRDLLWRGRDDFTYRLSVGALPWIDAAEPLDAPPGTACRPDLRGWNLPPAAAVALPVRTGCWPLPGVPGAAILVDAAPPADDAAAELAYPAAAPGLLVRGTFAAAGGEVRLRIRAPAGPFRAEIAARRLGLPTDAALELRTAAGAPVAAVDDTADPADGLRTQQLDPVLCAELPAAGAYVLAIREAQGRSGRAFAWRLRLGPVADPPAVLALPSAAAAPRGGAAALGVRVIPPAGTAAGACTIGLAEPVPGLRVAGGRCAGGATRAVVTIAADDDAPPVCALRLVARADDGAIWPVTPADDVMQAFLWRHLVPAPDLVLVVGEPAPLRLRLPARLALPRGRETAIAVAIERRSGHDGAVRLELVDPPPGVILRRGHIAAGADGGSAVIRVERDADAPAEWNLALAARIQLPPSPDAPPDAKPRSQRVIGGAVVAQTPP